MEPQLCYILDAILFLYGIVLTVLYCRLKVSTRSWPVATCDPAKPLAGPCFWGTPREAQ